MPPDLESDVIITEELARRGGRAPALDAERAAFRNIAANMSAGSAQILQVICDSAISVCRAGSSGVSMLRTIDGEECFSWDVLGGRVAAYVGGRAPRHHSPCGVTLARGTPQLFSYPERRFEFLQQADVPIVEGLVVPLYNQRKEPYGTIWIMSHDPGIHFDCEDVRLMTELGGYASTALRLLGAFEDYVD